MKVIRHVEKPNEKQLELDSFHFLSCLISAVY